MTRMSTLIAMSWCQGLMLPPLPKHSQSGVCEKHLLNHYLTLNAVDEIVEAFPFFLALHRIFSSHPNVTPIAIMTGVSPRGKKTVYFQALSDDEQDISSPAFTLAQHSQMLSLH